MAEDTFVEAEIWSVARTNQGNAVLVRPVGADVAVPIFIGPLETQSIVIGLGGMPVPRPLTHDLAVDILKACGRTVARIEIWDLREGTFYGRLVLVPDAPSGDSPSVDGLRSPGAGEEVVDSRPSDALAIAVRVKCRIFIAEHVVEEAGIPVDLMTPDSDKEGPASGGSADPGFEGLDLFGLSGQDGAKEGVPEGDIHPGAPDPGAEGQASSRIAPQGIQAERKRLLDALERAVDGEDYETAALIRDKLRELEDEL